MILYGGTNTFFGPWGVLWQIIFPYGYHLLLCNYSPGELSA
jgi:hypothetical protein